MAASTTKVGAEGGASEEWVLGSLCPGLSSLTSLSSSLREAHHGQLSPPGEPLSPRPLTSASVPVSASP